ncbi:DUF427 domain-containing protein [Pseudoroseomonas globiformis]|uniref:DUF427 domain-containing protein n=1 Tax=Teichococcus globiformis TaxID=2307229 RepID=A0ABV7G0G7_9PROT
MAGRDDGAEPSDTVPRITITPCHECVIVSAGGRTVAESCAALVLREGDYPPVFYIPRSDVRMTLLSRSELVTHCPHKGQATHFSIAPGGDRGLNAAWSYEAPLRQVCMIRDHLAFYPDRVDSIATRPRHERSMRH